MTDDRASGARPLRVLVAPDSFGASMTAAEAGNAIAVGWRQCAASDVVSGSAIIEDAWSTVVVPPGWQARPDATGNLFLTRGTP